MANKLHIDAWIRRAEPDFYGMFIDTWIPFNAWYVDKYQDTNDAENIKKLATTQNEIKGFIKSLLLKTDPDHERFCYHLSQLHIELDKKNLIHRSEMVSFRGVFFEKYVCPPFDKTDINGVNYQASQPTRYFNQFKAQIVKENKTYLSIGMEKYDLAALITHEQYVGLASEEMKESIKECFIKINPAQKIAVTSDSKNPKDYILIANNKGCKFKNNPELIASGLIKILYLLRCMLFHGEINPTDHNSVVYEHAFYVLRFIIKKIK